MDGVLLFPTLVPSNLFPQTRCIHRRLRPPGQCCVSKKKSVLLQQSSGTCYPLTSKKPVSLLMWISNLWITSPSTVCINCPSPQPLILPSDEGKRGRGVVARGSDWAREGGREGEMEKEMEIEGDPTKKKKKTTCFRDLTFAEHSLLQKNVQRWRPMKLRGGLAQFSNTVLIHRVLTGENFALHFWCRAWMLFILLSSIG